MLQRQGWRCFPVEELDNLLSSIDITKGLTKQVRQGGQDI
jgi:hypothetical protein